MKSVGWTCVVLVAATIGIGLGCGGDGGDGEGEADVKPDPLAAVDALCETAQRCDVVLAAGIPPDRVDSCTLFVKNDTQAYFDDPTCGVYGEARLAEIACFADASCEVLAAAIAGEGPLPCAAERDAVNAADDGCAIRDGLNAFKVVVANSDALCGTVASCCADEDVCPTVFDGVPADDAAACRAAGVTQGERLSADKDQCELLASSIGTLYECLDRASCSDLAAALDDAGDECALERENVANDLVDCPL